MGYCPEGESMHICWVTIHVSNMEESKKFYCDVIGLKVKTEFSPRPGMRICFLDGGTTDYELIENSDDGNEQPFSKRVSVGFQVDALDAKIEVLKNKGITAITGPMQPSPTTRFIFITDPDGMMVQLVEQLEKK